MRGWPVYRPVRRSGSVRARERVRRPDGLGCLLVFALQPRFNLFGIGLGIRQGRAELLVGEPVIRPGELRSVPAERVVRARNLEHVDAGAGNAGAPAGWSIGKRDPRNAAHLYRFAE